MTELRDTRDLIDRLTTLIVLIYGHAEPIIVEPTQEDILGMEVQVWWESIRRKPVIAKTARAALLSAIDRAERILAGTALAHP